MIYFIMLYTVTYTQISFNPHSVISRDIIITYYKCILLVLLFILHDHTFYKFVYNTRYTLYMLYTYTQIVFINPQSVIRIIATSHINTASTTNTKVVIET